MVIIFAFVLCICCWWLGDVSFRTKAVLTLLYLASFGLIFVREQSYLFVIAQCIWVAIFGVVAFGIDYLNRRP